MIRVALPAEICKRMGQALRRAGSREIGGILMGEQTAPGQFRVVDLSIDEVSGERAHFVREAAHHRGALQAFFERTAHSYERFNYLGEWHSHPGFPAAPSPTDVLAMQELVEGDRDIDFSCLLIAKLTFFRRLVVSMSLHRRGSAPEAVHLHQE